MVQRREHAEKIVDIANDLRISGSHLYNIEAKYNQDQPLVDQPRERVPQKYMTQQREESFEK
jgi:hypothetical protein